MIAPLFNTRALIRDTNDQIKSNIGFCGEEKTGVPEEKPLKNLSEEIRELTNSTHI